MNTVDFLVQEEENGVQIYNDFKIHPGKCGKKFLT